MAKNDFQYAGWNSYTLQWGTITTLISSGDCTMICGSGMTCHWICPNGRHMLWWWWQSSSVLPSSRARRRTRRREDCRRCWREYLSYLLDRQRRRSQQPCVCHGYTQTGIYTRDLRSFEIRFDSKVTGQFENFESPRLPRLPSYHKQHSLFNDKFQSFRHCYWDLYWV